MSLPQRKKSAEEIAKLRESLGIPGQGPPTDTTPAEETVPASEEPVEMPVPDEATPPPAEPPVEEPVTASLPEVEVLAPSPEAAGPPKTVSLSPLPSEPAAEPKVVWSLKRSERIPVLPVESGESSGESGKLPPQQPAVTLPTLQTSRQVRSLRKSEQGPLPAVQPVSGDSKLPTHRHNEKEIGDIRRREALAQISPQAAPKVLAAHPAFYIPGYLAAIAAGVSFYYYDFDVKITAALAAFALAVAGLVFFRWPLSRHHAAFIAVLSLFVIVFGALHYFPQLTHGT